MHEFLRRGGTRRLRWSFAAFLAISFAALSPAEPPGVRLAISAPRDVDLSQLEVVLKHEPYSEIEPDRDADVPAVLRPRSDGTLEIAVDEIPPPYIEVIGPGVRRAVFPFPKSGNGEGAERHQLTLESGAGVTVRVVSTQDRAPIAAALFGPIVPDFDASVEALDKTYPFFAWSDAQGRAEIFGLAPRMPYTAQVEAPGYERTRIRIPPGTGVLEVQLKPGGRRVSGNAFGLRSLEPIADQPLLLETFPRGPRGLHMIRRADAEGNFEFGGLPAGAYRLAPFMPRWGAMPVIELTVPADADLDGQAVGVPEGAAVSGFVSDVESAEPVSGAAVLLGPATVRSDASGFFASEVISGPWPIEPIVRHADYSFITDDQPAESRSLYPENWNDLTGVHFELRRNRYLEIHRADAPAFSENPEIGEGKVVASALLYLWDLENDSAADNLQQRHRLSSDPAIVSLASAGRRVLFARDETGQVSDFGVIATELDQTTTTVKLALGRGAALTGIVAYEDGEPVGGANIQYLYRDAESAAEISFASSIAAAETGAFSADRLPPGEILVRAMNSAETRVLGERPLVLERGATSELEIVVIRGKTLQGRVVDEGDEPLPEIPIVVYGSDTLGDAMRLDALTDADGQFEIEGLGGDFVSLLSIDHVEYAPLSREQLPLHSDELTLRLRPRSGIVVRLSGNSSGARAQLLLGQLRSTESAPDQWYYEPVREIAFADDGTATLRPRQEGRFCVAAESDGAFDVSTPFDWTMDGESREISLTPGCSGSLEISFQGIEPNEIDGLLIDLFNTARPGDEAVAVVSQRQGDRLSFAGLGAGNYLVLATTTRLAQAVATNIEISCGSTASRSLVLGGDEGYIAGRVVSEGEPIAAAEITLYFAGVAEADPLDRQSTGANGGFRFAPLPSDRKYLLIVSHDSRQTQLEVAAPFDGVEIVIEPLVAVSLLLPADLRETAEKNPAIPFLIYGDSGATSTVSLGSLDSLKLVPGDYRVNWGERPLGSIAVSPHGGAVRLQLR